MSVDRSEFVEEYDGPGWNVFSSLPNDLQKEVINLAVIRYRWWELDGSMHNEEILINDYDCPRCLSETLNLLRLDDYEREYCLEYVVGHYIDSSGEVTIFSKWRDFQEGKLLRRVVFMSLKDAWMCNAREMWLYMMRNILHVPISRSWESRYDMNHRIQLWFTSKYRAYDHTGRETYIAIPSYQLFDTSYNVFIDDIAEGHRVLMFAKEGSYMEENIIERFGVEVIEQCKWKIIQFGKSPREVAELLFYPKHGFTDWLMYSEYVKQEFQPKVDAPGVLSPLYFCNTKMRLLMDPFD